MSNMLNLTLKVWRQDRPKSRPATFETYETTIADDASFLEMLDYVNEDLIAQVTASPSRSTTTAEKASVERAAS